MLDRPLELHRLDFIMEPLYQTPVFPSWSRSCRIFRTSTYLSIMLPKPTLGCRRYPCICPSAVFDDVKDPVGHLHYRIDSIWHSYAHIITRFLLKQRPLQCVDERPPLVGLHEALRLSARRAATDVAPTPDPSV